MLKNFLLWLLIFCIIYILLILNIPSISKKLENTILLNWINNFILQFKWTYNDTIKNVPTQNEFKNAYNSIQSWAIDFKENFDLWVDYTKERIDSIRWTLSWVNDSIWDIKNTYDETKQFIDTNSWVIKNVQDTIQTNSWVIKKVWEVINTYSWALN